MKRLLCFLAVILLLSGCGKKEKETQPPAEFAQYYDSVIQAWLSGTEEELFALLHYDRPEYEALVEGLFENAAECEIKSWEKIHDGLWEVTSDIRLESEEEGTDCYHFVGLVDGSLKVMIGKHNVPDALKQGYDLSKFSYPDALPMEDLVLEES